MQCGSIRFLQVMIGLFGLAALGFLLWEPHVEGRNINANWFQIYFQDPFLAYVYLSSIPFFVALTQALSFLGHIQRQEAFSPGARKALETIRKCGRFTVAAAGGALLWILWSETDDRAGGVALCLAVSLGSIGAIAAADVLERVLKSATK